AVTASAAGQGIQIASVAALAAAKVKTPASARRLAAPAATATPLARCRKVQITNGPRWPPRSNLAAAGQGGDDEARCQSDADRRERMLAHLVLKHVLVLGSLVAGAFGEFAGAGGLTLGFFAGDRAGIFEQGGKVRAQSLHVVLEGFKIGFHGGRGCAVAGGAGRGRHSGLS